MSYRVVAEIFGIEEPHSNMDLIEIVRHGLPSASVTILSDVWYFTCDFSRPFRHPIFMTIPPGTAL